MQKPPVEGACNNPLQRAVERSDRIPGLLDRIEFVAQLAHFR